jgi:hypothetical protein
MNVPDNVGYVYRVLFEQPEQPPQNLHDASIRPVAREIIFEWKYGDYVSYHGERVRVYLMSHI